MPGIHDIYLAGAWERYCKTPYKTIIKNSLPHFDIYDPEDYQDGDWFEADLEAIQNSKCIICYASNIPMCAATFELGYFYAVKRLVEVDSKDLKHIILVWEDSVEPTFSKEWHVRSGYLVSSVESAVKLFRELYE